MQYCPSQVLTDTATDQSDADPEAALLVADSLLA